MAYVREIKGRWYCCYRDPNGKQRTKACGAGTRGKKNAEQKCRQIEGLILLGEYEDKKAMPWGQLDADGRLPIPTESAKNEDPKTFMEEFYRKRISLNRDRSQTSAWEALAHFTRIVKPRTIGQITAAEVDEYIRVRTKEDGKRILSETVVEGRAKRGQKTKTRTVKKSRVSPATVNKELRSIRAALRCAKRWGYLKEVPEIYFLREDGKEVIFVDAEQFSLLYQHADASDLHELQSLPNGLTGPELMRALMMFMYMTGWRITQTVELNPKSDINMETGEVFSPSDRNKGHRDVLCRLHPIILEELKPLKLTFGTRFIPDGVTLKMLYRQFRRIQDAAGVRPARGKRYFGFHDLRRGFATANADNLNLFELQALMQHKSLETTKLYVAMAKRANSVDKLVAPNVKRPKQA